MFYLEFYFKPKNSWSFSNFGAKEFFCSKLKMQDTVCQLLSRGSNVNFRNNVQNNSANNRWATFTMLAECK